MRVKPIAVAASMAATLCAASAAAEDVAVKMTDLARNPDAYVGKRVVISDCMVMAWASIVGIQCSPAPLDATALAYVDVDTMSAAGKKVGEECDTVDITNKCLVKVTGDVAKNARGQALIKNATVEILKRVPAL